MRLPGNNGIRFGWGTEIHRALTRAACPLIAPQIRDSFEKNIDWLRNEAYEMDFNPTKKGKASHFIVLEDRPTLLDRLPVIPKPQQRFETVFPLFSLRAKMEKIREFAEHPLTHEELMGTDNVYRSLDQAFSRLNEALLNALDPDASAGLREASARNAMAAMAEGLHYVQDANQAWHATGYGFHALQFDEAVVNQARQGKTQVELRDPRTQSFQKFYDGQDLKKLYNPHIYYEHYMMPADAVETRLNEWVETSKDENHPQASQSDFRQRIVRGLEEGYLGLYDFMAADARARAESKDSLSYQQKLDTAWSQAAQPQLQRSLSGSAEFVNTALHLAEEQLRTCRKTPDYTVLNSISMTEGPATA